MKKTFKLWFAGIIIILIMFAGYLLFRESEILGLSKLQSPVSCSTQGTSATSLATTSVTYMGVGTATTTATCNMALAGDATEVFDDAVLTIQFTGSSTASVLNTQIEYSQDSIDWYSDRLTAGATTTQTINIAQPTTYTWNFASTTMAGVTGTASVDTNIITVPTPMKYVRAVFTATGANSAIWANFTGKTLRK